MNNNEFINACRLQLFVDLQQILEKDPSNGHLKHQAYSLIFSQGLTHASKGTSIFYDRYLRAGMLTEADYTQSLLCTVMASISESSILIPMHDLVIAEHILPILINTKKEFFDFKIVKPQLYGAEIVCVAADYTGDLENQKSKTLELIRYVGLQGAIANKDTLISLFTNSIINDNPVVLRGTQQLSNKHEDIALLHAYIIKLLSTPVQKKDPRILHQQAHEFYLNFIKKLVSGLFLEKQNLYPQSERMIIDSLKRMRFKISYAITNSDQFSSFILGLEFAFDEIAFILSILKMYSQNELLQLITTTFNNDVFEKNPELIHPAVAGCCMNVLNMNMRAAINYFATSENNPVSVYMPVLYHEFPTSWQLPIEFNKDRYIVMNGHNPSSIATYEEQIVDVMILSTNENVNLLKSGHDSYDLHLMINKQLALRKASDPKRQLIIIVDATMNFINDVQLELLLEAYKDNIQKGEMAILMVSSLNKFRNGCGFDRAPGGACVCYFNSNKFPALECLQGLVGFKEYDTTPQVMAHTIKYGLDSMYEYSYIIQGLSRYIHDNLIPTELFNDQNPLSIDKPYTRDLYANPWSFLVIRFSSLELQERIKPLLFKFLEKLGIHFRAGFAYNQTAVSLPYFGKLVAPRIGIAPDANSLQFYLIAKYISHINQAILESGPHQITDAHLVDISNKITIAAENLYNAPPKKTTRLMLQ